MCLRDSTWICDARRPQQISDHAKISELHIILDQLDDEAFPRAVYPYNCVPSGFIVVIRSS